MLRAHRCKKDTNGHVSGRRSASRTTRSFRPNVGPSLEDRTLASLGLGDGPPSLPIRSSFASRVHSQASRSFTNLTYTTRAGHPEQLDLLLPAGKAPAGGWPVVLAFPGGGWRWTSRKGLETQVNVLTQYGFAVASADYAYGSSQVGTKIWPLNFQDVQDAVRYLRAHADNYSLNPNWIAAFGQSSGAHLASLLGTSSVGASSAGAQAPPRRASGSFSDVSASVQAVVDFYGPTDLAALYAQDPKDRAFMETFLGGSPGMVPQSYQQASPALQVAPGDPPFLIVQGANDTTVLPTQSTELAEALKQAGVPYRLMVLPNLAHGFPLTANYPVTLPGVVNFLDQALSNQPITG
jgi:acetyl esterase/lipase